MIREVVDSTPEGFIGRKTGLTASIRESDACINQFRYRLLKVIEVAGKHILNIFLD